MTGQREAILLLFYSIAVGFGLGLVYDVFRVLRIAAYGRKKAEKNKMIPLSGDASSVEKLLKAKSGQVFPNPSFFVIFVCDIAFCVFSALTVTVMLFQFGDGRMRAFSLLGAFAGFVVYYFTIGKAVIFFSNTIISAVKTLVKTVLKFTLYPVCAIIYRIGNKIKELLHAKKRVKNTKKYVKTMLEIIPKCNSGENTGKKK